MNARMPQPEPPFAVMMAGFVVDFHHRNACSRCQSDGSCPRLARAGDTLLTWKARVGQRAGLMPARIDAESAPEGPRVRLSETGGGRE